jgi:hypothetical protein
MFCIGLTYYSFFFVYFVILAVIFTDNPKEQVEIKIFVMTS